MEIQVKTLDSHSHELLVSKSTTPRSSKSGRYPKMKPTVTAELHFRVPFGITWTK